MIEHIKRHSRTVFSYGSVAIAASTLGMIARPLVTPPPIVGGQAQYRLAVEGESVPPGAPEPGPRGESGPPGSMPSNGMPGGPDGMGEGPREEGRPPFEDRGREGAPPPEADRREPSDMSVRPFVDGADNRTGDRFERREGQGMEGDRRSPPDMGDQSRMGDDRRGNGLRNEEQQQQWEEMEKKQEEERKAMEAKQLEQIKRGLAQAKRGLAMMKKAFDKATSKGAPIPSDCQTALKAAEDTLLAAEKAQTLEEIQDANAEDLRDHFETLNECRMTMEKITRAQQILKRLDRDLKSIERRWNRAKRSPTAEMQEAVNEGEGILKQIKDKRVSLDALLKEGNVDDFEDTLEDDIYGRFDDLDTVMRHLEAMRNAKRFLKEYTQRMRQAEQMIAKLKRAKQDTNALEELLTRAKAQYEIMKALKPGTDEFDEALKELFDIEQEFALEFHGDQDFSSELDIKPSQKPNDLRLEF